MRTGLNAFQDENVNKPPLPRQDKKPNNKGRAGEKGDSYKEKARIEMKSQHTTTALDVTRNERRTHPTERKKKGASFYFFREREPHSQ